MYCQQSQVLAGSSQNTKSIAVPIVPTHPVITVIAPKNAYVAHHSSIGFQPAYRIAGARHETMCKAFQECGFVMTHHVDALHGTTQQYIASC